MLWPSVGRPSRPLIKKFLGLQPGLRPNLTRKKVYSTWTPQLPHRQSLRDISHAVAPAAATAVASTEKIIGALNWASTCPQVNHRRRLSRGCRSTARGTRCASGIRHALVRSRAALPGTLKTRARPHDATRPGRPRPGAAVCGMRRGALSHGQEQQIIMLWRTRQENNCGAGCLRTHRACTQYL